MPTLFPLAQIYADSPNGWWWSTLTSRPALLLLALAIGCLVVLLYLGWRLRSVAAMTPARPVRERMADDSGVAMIEFVLVTPILLGVTLLLLQTMLVFTGLFYVQYSAFAAARSAIVYIPLQTESSEEHNWILPSRGSEKFDAIESAAMIAVMPVSGREGNGSSAAASLSAGVARVFQEQNKSEPAWVDKLLAQRMSYAINHTDVTLHTVRPGNNSESVIFEEVVGLTEITPKEAIAATVRHEFALTIPVASRVFAVSGRSGSYSPATRGKDSPSIPGQWTVIEARAILTNEGIDRRLPEAPPVPRR